jgi:hypothetical protein
VSNKRELGGVGCVDGVANTDKVWRLCAWFPPLRGGKLGELGGVKVRRPHPPAAGASPAPKTALKDFLRSLERGSSEESITQVEGKNGTYVPFLFRFEGKNVRANLPQLRVSPFKAVLPYDDFAMPTLSTFNHGQIAFAEMKAAL